MEWEVLRRVVNRKERPSFVLKRSGLERQNETTNINYSNAKKWMAWQGYKLDHERCISCGNSSLTRHRFDWVSQAPWTVPSTPSANNCTTLKKAITGVDFRVPNSNSTKYPFLPTAPRPNPALEQGLLWSISVFACCWNVSRKVKETKEE